MRSTILPQHINIQSTMPHLTPSLCFLLHITHPLMVLSVHIAFCLEEYGRLLLFPGSPKLLCTHLYHMHTPIDKDFIGNTYIIMYTQEVITSYFLRGLRHETPINNKGVLAKCRWKTCNCKKVIFSWNGNDAMLNDLSPQGEILWSKLCGRSIEWNNSYWQSRKMSLFGDWMLFCYWFLFIFYSLLHH